MSCTMRQHVSLPDQLPLRIVVCVSPQNRRATDFVRRRAGAAARDRSAALRSQPDAAGIHNNLGGALSLEPGRLQEAIQEYETALRIQPDYPDARYNLEVALSKARAAKLR